VSINDPEELEALRAAGAIVRRVLEAMKQQVRPGITTGELDAIGAAVIEKNGARSAPATVYNFPGANCISLNEEAVHGVPGKRVLQSGDLLKLDVTIEKDGFMADAAETVAVGVVTPEAQRLMACARRAPSKRPCWWPAQAFAFPRSAARSNAKCGARGFP
jgi:methionyl aminopeptidase